MHHLTFSDGRATTHPAGGPLASPAEGRSPNAEEASPRTATAQASLRILVADDNEVLRAAVRGLLQSLGHSVDVVTNGREAIESAAREDFDFVFLDIQMPEMDGFAAAHSLRHQYAGGRPPRIIGLSGESEGRESYSAAGMDDFLLKPVRLADLVHALRYHSRS
jgi:CheY-like chemotaxis protein